MVKWDGLDAAVRADECGGRDDYLTKEILAKLRR